MAAVLIVRPWGLFGKPEAPARKTPRPRIRGLQTARVTGASHEEQAIHVDELGRVLRPVRRVVGCLVEVGTGRMDPAMWIRRAACGRAWCLTI